MELNMHSGLSRTRDSRSGQSKQRVMKKTISAALAGCLATAPMTASMLWMHHRLPWRERYALPPAQISARIADAAGLEEHMDAPRQVAATLLAHFGYGAAAGGLYAQVQRWLPGPPVTRGMLFGIFVWTSSYLGLLPALGLLRSAAEHPVRRSALMIVAHLVWGGAMALIIEQLETASAKSS
jgi:uncharacterized membrane protein YagU involved in acid resistance